MKASLRRDDGKSIRGTVAYMRRTIKRQRVTTEGWRRNQWMV